MFDDRHPVNRPHADDIPERACFHFFHLELHEHPAAPLPVEVQEAFEKLTRGRLVEGYGLTECGPVTHANPLNGMRKVGSIGIPFPSTEACVVDLVRGRKKYPSGRSANWRCAVRR